MSLRTLPDDLDDEMPNGEEHVYNDKELALDIHEDVTASSFNSGKELILNAVQIRIKLLNQE